MIPFYPPYLNILLVCLDYLNRKTVLIEICFVHLSHEYEKEVEEDDIPPPYIHPLPTPQLVNYPHPQGHLLPLGGKY